MIPTYNPFGASVRAADIMMASSAPRDAIHARQRQRLRDLIGFARSASPFYRSLYRGLADDVDDVAALPVVTKAALMDHFDDVVTDRRITRRAVEDFAARKDRIGHLMNGRYALWKSSGTTGDPALFLHDRDALATYDMLFFTRVWSPALTPARLASFWGQGARMACVTANEDHYAGIASWRRMAIGNPMLRSLVRDYSVLEPLDTLVARLNEWRPAQLVGYPSILALLAHEQIEGRLKIAPSLVIVGGECFDDDEHDLIEKAFGALVRAVYACAECDYIAFECKHRWLHVNADWIILEPVDKSLKPVPAGTPSHTCLLTNLANRVQPIIRYEIPDSATVRADPCPCGSPLPAIRVEGRRNQALRLPSGSGETVAVLPMAITTVLELIPGLRRFQIDRTGLTTLLVRCEFEAGADKESIRSAILERLREFLTSKDLGGVEVALSEGGFKSAGAGGKFQQVMSSYDEAQGS